MATSKLAISMPSSDDPVIIADWLETHLLLTGRQVVSRSWIRSALQNSTFPEDRRGINDLLPDLDVTIESVIAELLRRRAMCGTKYPFGFTNQLIEYQPSEASLAYAFLLLVCTSVLMRDERRHAEVDWAFDTLALEALRAAWADGVGVRFGTPASEDRPRVFARALEWLCGRMRLRRGPLAARSATNDGGADVIAWRPFRDGRSGFITVIAQCTVRRDWRPKALDVKPTVWAGWVDFGFAPLSALAIPFIVPLQFDQWDELRRTVNLILDRLRLIELLTVPSPELRSALSTWTTTEMRKLGASPEAVPAVWRPKSPEPGHAVRRSRKPARVQKASTRIKRKTTPRR